MHVLTLLVVNHPLGGLTLVFISLLVYLIWLLISLSGYLVCLHLLFAFLFTSYPTDLLILTICYYFIAFFYLVHFFILALLTFFIYFILTYFLYLLYSYLLSFYLL